MKTHNLIGLIHFVLTPFLILFKGFVFTRLWQWFAVEVFHVAPLGVLNAAGVMLMAGYAVAQIRSTPLPESEEDKEHRASELLGASIFYPLICWGVGAIIHAFA